MTFRLQGPYPLDLQDVGGSARTAMGDARFAMADRDFSARLRQSTAIGERRALPAVGRSRRREHPRRAGPLGFWLTFGPSYVEGGPRSLWTATPFAGSPSSADRGGLVAGTAGHLRAGAPVAPSSCSNARGARQPVGCPPPGVPTRQNDDRPAEQDTVGFWELDELGETETSMVTPEVDEPEEPALPVARSSSPSSRATCASSGAAAASHQLVHLAAAAAASDAPLPRPVAGQGARRVPRPTSSTRPWRPWRCQATGSASSSAGGSRPPSACSRGDGRGRVRGARPRRRQPVEGPGEDHRQRRHHGGRAGPPPRRHRAGVHPPWAHASTAAPQPRRSPRCRCAHRQRQLRPRAALPIKATGANGPLSERVCGDKPERGQESHARPTHPG